MIRIGGVAAAIVLVASVAQAESKTQPDVPVVPCDATIRVDHRARSVQVIRGARVRYVKDWQKTIEIETKDPVCFQVVNTSTAAYRFEVADVPIDAAGIAALATFAKVASPYALDLGKQSLEGGEFVARSGVTPEVKEALATLAASLEALPLLVRGPNGIEDTAFKATAAMQAMSLDPATSAPRAAQLKETLEPRFECAAGTIGPGCPKQLIVIREVTERYLAADKAVGVLEKALASIEADDLKEAIGAQIAAWQEWRGKFSLVIAAARRAEELARIAMDAKSEWVSKKFEATWRTGHELTLKISQREDVELDVLGGRDAMKVVVRVMPKNSIRFTAGAALLAAPDAKFDTYGVANQGGPTIVRSGSVDQRFFWALTLAMNPDVLDWTDRSGFAVWIPELVLSPGPERAMGIGTGISWKKVRVGGGALWVRHTQLADGQEVGQQLGTGEVLRTKDGYDFANPVWYGDVALFF